MSGINKVILIGRLGAKPEYKEFDNGGSKARFSLATSEKWNDSNTGEKKERTEWHRVVLRVNQHKTLIHKERLHRLKLNLNNQLWLGRKMSLKMIYRFNHG